MRTTIDINDATLRQLRDLATRSGRPFRQVVDQALSLGLAQFEKQKTQSRFRVRPHPLGLKPGFHGTSLNQLYDQLEAEDSLKKSSS